MDSHRLHPTPPAHATQEADSLLAELGWLRRVCRALVSDAGEAEDLAQDVWIEALRRPPRLVGARLRGWLRVVARRRAGARAKHHRLTRESDQVWGEGRAGTKDDAPAADRLDLHRRLLSTIDDLPTVDREVIVASYLEERSAAEIGGRLGLTEGAVRQRRRRALAELRTRLVAEDEDWPTWLPALALCAPLPGPPTFGRHAPSKASLSPTITAPLLLTQAMLWKALTAAVLVLAAAYWALIPTDVAPPSGDVDLSSAATGRETIDLVAAASRQNPREALGELSALEEPSAALDEGLGAPASTLRVVDRSGEIVPKAKGLWLDARQRPTDLGFDSSGRASRPSSDAGIAFVAAPGFSLVESMVPSCEAGAESTLVMEPQRSLQIHLKDQDGVKLEEPLAFQCFTRPNRGSLTDLCEPAKEFDWRSVSAASGETDLQRLSQGGVLRVDQGIMGADVTVILPDRVRGVSTDPPSELTLGGCELKIPASLFQASDAPPFTLVLERMPSIQGQSLWADSGLPALGTFKVMRRLFRSNGSRHVELPQPVAIQRDGTFTIAADFHDMFGLGIRFAGEGRALVFTLEADATGARYNATISGADLDSGDEAISLRWHKHASQTLEIVEDDPLDANSSRPVAAAVGADGESARADASGLASISASPGSLVWVYGPKHRPVAVDLGHLEQTPADDPIRVSLERTFAIEVSFQPGTDTHRTSVQITSKGPVLDEPGPSARTGTTSLQDSIPLWDCYRLLGAKLTLVHGGDVIQGVSFEPRKGAPLVIPGITMDEPVNVSWTNEFGQVLDTRSLLLRADTELRFPAEECELANLEVITTLRGTSVPAVGEVKISPKSSPDDNLKSVTLPLIGGRAQTGVLLPGEYELKFTIRQAGRSIEARDTVVVEEGANATKLEF